MGMNMSLDENLTLQADEGKIYYDKYRQVFEALEDSPRAKLRKIDAFDWFKLGRQISTMEAHFARKAKMRESSDMSSLGPLQNIALRVIALHYGISPAGELAATQPIKTRNGFVLFRNSVLQTTRGNGTAGQKLLNPLGVPDVYPKDIARNTRRRVPVIADSNGIQSYDPTPIAGDEELMEPIYNRGCFVDASIVFTTANGAIIFPPMEVNPETGYFSAVADNDGSNVYITGTVDFQEGTLEVDLSGNPDGQTNIYVTYEVVAESAVDVPRIHSEWVDKPVRAEWYTLATDWGMFEEYIAANEYGVNLPEELVKDLVGAMNAEICRRIIDLIVANRPNANTKTWKRQPQSGVSSVEHAFAMRQTFNDADALLLKTAGRGEVTAWVVGRNFATRFKDIDGFNQLSEKSWFGPHIFGTWNGVTIIRVPANEMLDENHAYGVSLISDFEAPVVNCPYMALMMTDELPHGLDNPFRRQKGVATSTAIEPMVTNLITRVVLDETSFNYGAAS